MSIHATLENVFLKIFRYTVLVLMTLAILAVPVLLLTAAYKFLHTPGTAPSTEQTLSKELSVDKVKESLLKEASKKNQPAQEDPKPQAPQENSALIYKDKALEIYKCGDEFKKATGANVEVADAAQTDREIEFIRSNMERLATPEYRGDAYASGMVSFVCKALKDSSIIALKKEGKIGSVLIPTINMYTAAWDSAVKKNDKYEADEIANAAIDRVEAVLFLYAAGALFLGFMVLAIYLMISRVENHISGINASLKKADISVKG